MHSPSIVALSAVWALVMPPGLAAGSASSPGVTLPVEPPSGALVLFDGRDTSAWQHRDGAACRWPLKGGGMMTRGGDLLTNRKFQDFQLHIEFWIPPMGKSVKGQARGNSGVYLQERYEIQVLDSYGLELTQGDCGAIYGQKIPDVNACRPAGKWQSYDITFQAARFDAEGNKTRNARVTVLQNGVMIHDDVEIMAQTGGGKPEDSEPRSLLLQDHGNRVRFRNIWIVPAAESGFKILFDQDHTDGWAQAGPGGFKLADGVATPFGGMGLWYYEKKTFTDFILQIEFQQKSIASNSGVYVRFPRVDGDPWIPVREGYEIQIAGDKPAKHATGSIYSFQAPTAIPLKPAGEWNAFEITCIGQQYTVKLNGELINTYLGHRSLTGMIGVQNHDNDGSGFNRVRYRNIRVKELKRR